MYPSKMGEANENRRRSGSGSSSSREMSNLSLQIDKYPRDLLQRFMSSEAQASTRSEGEEEEEDEELELNLGLSLGGRFGVDKNAKKLTRSSSIAGSIPIFRDNDANTPPTVPYPTLIRTSSLPTETEEEWRKRKELQTLRRMAAKRRRSEKQRSSREKMEVNLLEEEKQRANSIGVGPAFGLQSRAAAARQVMLGGGREMVGLKGKGGAAGSYSSSPGFMQPSSQGSMESQGGSSSSLSEMENKTLQGASSCGEARSSGSTQSLQDQGNQEATGPSGAKTSETSRTSRLEVETLCKTVENRGKERGNAMEDMPCVFTKGEGPNGKTIEGILYKYGKGEEVRIMCVCHGNFLSPAEFVKHAGGGDVDHPLRHIVVNPSAASLL